MEQPRNLCPLGSLCPEYPNSVFLTAQLDFFDNTPTGRPSFMPSARFSSSASLVR